MPAVLESLKAKRFRLWSVLLLLGAARFLSLAAATGELHHTLMGVGMVLAAIFAFRHDLLDISPSGLDSRRVGRGWLALLASAALLMLAAAALALRD